MHAELADESSGKILRDRKEQGNRRINKLPVVLALVKTGIAAAQDDVDAGDVLTGGNRNEVPLHGEVERGLIFVPKLRISRQGNRRIQRTNTGSAHECGINRFYLSRVGPGRNTYLVIANQSWIARSGRT